VSVSEHIPTTPLIAAGCFRAAAAERPGRARKRAGLAAERVAAAIADGLTRGGWPSVEVFAVPCGRDGPGELRAFLDADGFDIRLRRARAMVLATWRLDPQGLAQSAAFELATRARQAGVPAYAVTGENRLDPFDARMLDLQVIAEADSLRALAAAGLRLARLM
jgi:glycerate kinase